jgi:hypothetical protein
MTNRLDLGLRWWEQWLLERLAKSPRINRILVELPADPDPEDDYDDVDDERFETDLRQQLEWIYHGPEAERD